MSLCSIILLTKYYSLCSYYTTRPKYSYQKYWSSSKSCMPAAKWTCFHFLKFQLQLDKFPNHGWNVWHTIPKGLLAVSHSIDPVNFSKLIQAPNSNKGTTIHIVIICGKYHWSLKYYDNCRRSYMHTHIIPKERIFVKLICIYHNALRMF